MPTTPMDTVSLERDQLMLNQRPSLMPSTSMESITDTSLTLPDTDTSPLLPHMPVPTTPMHTVSLESDLLMLNQRPRPMLSTTMESITHTSPTLLPATQHIPPMDLMVTHMLDILTSDKKLKLAGQFYDKI